MVGFVIPVLHVPLVRVHVVIVVQVFALVPLVIVNSLSRDKY